MEKKKLISIGELLNKSFQFYKSKLYIVLVLSLIPFANLVIISLLFGLIDEKINNVAIASGLGLITLLVALFTVVLNFWVQLTFFYLIKEKNIPEDAKSLLTFSWAGMASYSWVLFLVGIITVLGFVLLIIPGIIFYVWYSVATYVFVFEDVKGMSALKKSKELVKGYWWPVFGRLFVFACVMGLIGAIPFIGNIINIFFTLPFGVIYGYFVYDDLKQIKA